MLSCPTSLSSMKMSNDGSSIVEMASSEKLMYLISSRLINNSSSESSSVIFLDIDTVRELGCLVAVGSFSKLSLTLTEENPSFCFVFNCEYSSSHEKTVCNSEFSFFISSSFLRDCWSVLNKIESPISLVSLSVN